MSYGSGTLQQGSSGSDVRQLQEFLNAHGAHLAVDGDFGPATAAAVRAYQSSVGITADGIVGPQTWSKITGSSSGKTSAPSSGSSDATVEAYVQQHFPGMMPLWNIPEVKNLFIQAYKNNWSDDQFLAAFRSTNYWKGHTGDQEAWITKSPVERGAEREQVAARMMTDLMQLYGTQAFAKRFGSANVTPQQFVVQHFSTVEAIASGATTYEAWLVQAQAQARTTSGTQAFADEQDRQQQLAQKLKTPQEVAEQLFQQAHGDYFVNLSKDDAVTWANNIINGKSSYGEFDDYLRKQASTLYPFYKDSIANGVLPKALFGPALNTLASELETSTDAVIANPKLWGEITAQAAGTKGQFTAADWTTYARSLPEWKKTQGAATMAGDFADKLLREFGQMA